MKVIRWFGTFFLIFVFSTAQCFAQANVNEEQGLKPYDALHGGDLDSVSLTSGGLALHIPVAGFPQRGDLDLSFFLRYFRANIYDPTTPEGLSQLAHELYHVGQYRKGEMTVKSYFVESMKHGGNENNKYERPAYEFEKMVLRGLTSGGGPWVGCQKP